MILLIEKKGLNHPEQRQHEHILNTGISLMVWGQVLYILMNFAKKRRGLDDGMWTKWTKFVQRKWEMCHFSIFWFVCGYVTIIHYQYDYLWLYLCHLMCLTLYLFHVEHSTGGSKYCHPVNSKFISWHFVFANVKYSCLHYL